MADRTFLDWPFFDDAHRRIALALDEWMGANGEGAEAGDLDARTKDLVARLGRGGWLRYTVPARYGGATEAVGLRSLCLLREGLARGLGELGDFAFAMQGLGSLPITLFGSEELRERYLPAVAGGGHLAAFALSEAGAGSDVAAIATRARRDGGEWVIDGEKRWISNAGIAHHYVVFARTGEAGSRGLSAFVVDADAPGLCVRERLELMSPHPIGTLGLRDCRVPATRLLGEPGDGFKIAMATLDVFRPTVGAAALGFARRALDEATTRAKERIAFGQAIAGFQLVQAKLAAMAVDVDASALFVYRAAYAKDRGAARITREAAMAKLVATEAAQRVIDGAVQLFGGLGVVSGMPVERLYRAVRALRIYEGTSEIQQLVIAQQLLRELPT